MSSLPSDCPEPVARVAGLMSGFRPPWFLCGGWAADSWLGRQSREHHDLDIAVFHEDQRAIFDHLSGWRLIGHDDSVADDSRERWDGRTLDLPAHIHARAEDRFELEVILNERAGEDWVLSREPLVRVSLAGAIQPSPWGVPAVVPEVIIYHKALPPAWRDGPRPALRPHDELDFVALLPLLGEAQVSWLRGAISLVDPGHQWLAWLRP